MQSVTRSSVVHAQFGSVGPFFKSMLLVAFCLVFIGCDDDDSGTNNNNNNNNQQCIGALTATVTTNDLGSVEFTGDRAQGTLGDDITTISSDDSDQSIVIQIFWYKEVDQLEVGKAYQVQDIANTPQLDREASVKLIAGPLATQYESVSGTITINEIKDKPNTGSATGKLLSGTFSTTLRQIVSGTNQAQISNGVFTEAVVLGL